MTDQPITTDTTDDEEERRRKGLLWLWLAVVVVLLAGLFALIQRLDGCSDTCGQVLPRGSTLAGGGTGASPPGNSQTAHSTVAHGAGASSVSIRVSGSERGGLAPGMSSPVVVKITNAGRTPARITSAGVAVGDATASCTAGQSIRVTHYNAAVAGAQRYDVAPGAVVRIPLTISMLDLASNQNSCKNVSFPLTFHATAQRG